MRRSDARDQRCEHRHKCLVFSPLSTDTEAHRPTVKPRGTLIQRGSSPTHVLVPLFLCLIPVTRANESAQQRYRQWTPSGARQLSPLLVFACLCLFLLHGHCLSEGKPPVRRHNGQRVLVQVEEERRTAIALSDPWSRHARLPDSQRGRDAPLQSRSALTGQRPAQNDWLVSLPCKSLPGPEHLPAWAQLTPTHIV